MAVETRGDEAGIPRADFPSGRTSSRFQPRKIGAYDSASARRKIDEQCGRRRQV